MNLTSYVVVSEDIPCGFCDGTGICRGCDGVGRIQKGANECPACDGSGRCDFCGGDGIFASKNTNNDPNPSNTSGFELVVAALAMALVLLWKRGW